MIVALWPLLFYDCKTKIKLFKIWQVICSDAVKNKNSGAYILVCGIYFSFSNLSVFCKEKLANQFQREAFSNLFKYVKGERVPVNCKMLLLT